MMYAVFVWERANPVRGITAGYKQIAIVDETTAKQMVEESDWYMKAVSEDDKIVLKSALAKGF